MKRLKIKTNGFGDFGSGPSVFVRKFVEGTRHHVVMSGDVGVLLLVTGDEAHFRQCNMYKKMVMRCDGMYYIQDDPKPPKIRNVGIVSRYMSADAHVFQSVYAKQFYEHVCGTRDVPSTIIYNGADLPFAGKENRNVGILCSTDARESKRQYLIPEIAQRLIKHDPKIEIVVIGSYKGKVLSNMRVLGKCSHTKLLSHYTGLTTFLDVSYQPACSNAIIEAAKAGMAVVASRSGGTPEFLLGSGLMYGETKIGYNEVKEVPRPDPDEMFDLVLQSFSMVPPDRNDLSSASMCYSYDSFLSKVVGQ